MLIRYDGGTRLVGSYEWSARTGRVQDLDAGTAVQVLTQPDERFEIDVCEPLLSLLSRRETEALLLAGIGSVEELAELKAGGILRVAQETGSNKAMVRMWIKAAREMVERGIPRVGAPVPDPHG